MQGSAGLRLHGPRLAGDAAPEKAFRSSKRGAISNRLPNDGAIPIVRLGEDPLDGLQAARLSSVLVLFSSTRPATIPLMLLPIPGRELSDDKVAAMLRDIIAGAGHYPRNIQLYFASICAEHLVDGLRSAGVLAVRPAPLRLTE
jgi:hypothetical protein